MQDISTEQNRADRLRWAWLVAGLLALGLSGCAQLQALKNRIGVGRGHASTPAPAPAPAPRATAPEPPPPALADIVNDQLQLGHYAEGARQLRRYLRAYPEDRVAQAMLEQLTVDPQQALGRASRSYVVRPGDSYSTLAARYLGDASRFLILARYNGSPNPSLLQAGQRLRLPVASARLSARPPEQAVQQDVQEHSPPPADAGTETKAQRLQDESLALLRKGDKAQALERMDEALDTDPRLPPSGEEAVTLRKQLVAVYHQRAIVLYRDQQLDQAIALWNRVLAIQPDFEPATVYRARALELKQRLKQF